MIRTFPGTKKETTTFCNKTDRIITTKMTKQPKTINQERIFKQLKLQFVTWVQLPKTRSVCQAKANIKGILIAKINE